MNFDQLENDFLMRTFAGHFSSRSYGCAIQPINTQFSEKQGWRFSPLLNLFSSGCLFFPAHTMPIIYSMLKTQKAFWLQHRAPKPCADGIPVQRPLRNRHRPVLRYENTPRPTESFARWSSAGRLGRFLAMFLGFPSRG